MRLVDETPAGLEIRWTWLPFWVVMSPQYKNVESQMKSICLLNGATNRDLDAIDRLAEELLVRYYPVQGFREYLHALRRIDV